SSDGLVDRLRAKLVGSTDFLPKPLKKEKVFGMLKKHLKSPQPAQRQNSQAIPHSSKNPQPL
ncbi:MAG: hypothetical protein QNJ46_13195, partial [Leptolyngbyaceae cyanobacterium MO_188.B28]|nr:hypothetical protein [Leptolyngbyaceae cyanobacterium MO_188.B28]